MEVKAKAKYIRMSPRKIRLVINAVRGMAVEEALTRLRFMKKAAALPVYKLIYSAMSNAVHNFHLDKSDLIIKVITVDGGPVLHRWRARAFGRAAPIRKRTAHIAVTLTELESKVGSAEEQKTVTTKEAVPVVKKTKKIKTKTVKTAKK